MGKAYCMDKKSNTFLGISHMKISPLIVAAAITGNIGSLQKATLSTQFIFDSSSASKLTFESTS